MKLSKKLTLNSLVLIGVSLIYFIYASVFIKPWTFKNFSLVDDGQVLLQSSLYFKDCYSSFKCEKFIDQTFEFGNSRFRPSYWIINNINHELFKLDATSYHIFRVYVVGLLIILSLSIILLRSGIIWPIVIISSLMFMSTFSFAENIIRLGTNEPYQILFIAIFSLLFLQIKNINKIRKPLLYLLVSILVWTILIKENNIALLLVIFFTEFILNRRKLFDRNLILIILIPLSIFLLGMLITKFLPSTISLEIPSYTSNYITHPKTIINNTLAIITLLFNTLSPFPKLSFILVPVLYINKSSRKIFMQRDFIYWILFSIFFVGILLPWKYVMDRYHLVGIFGIIIVISFILNEITKLIKHLVNIHIKDFKYKKVLFNLILLYVLSNLLFRGFSVNLAKTINYSNWFRIFTQFEGDQISALSKYEDGEILINAVNTINNWEFLYEIPIHMKYIYNNDFKVLLVDDDLIDKKYLFSRSSLDLYKDLNNIKELNLINSQSYVVEQIEPIEFRNQFTMKPLATISKPPLQKTNINYYWEIRRFQR